MTFVTKSADEFVPANRWIASLSNGETVYDDTRPNMPPAWIRLAEYVKENSLAITSLRAQVGRYIVPLPSHQDGYVQYKKVEAWGANGNLSLCVGFIQGGKCKIFLVGENGSSRSIVVADPGEPKAIYRCDKE